MNNHYQALIDLGKRLAEGRNLSWAIEANDAGRALDNRGWNLTEIAGDTPPTHYLRDFGRDAKVAALINAQRHEIGLPPLPAQTLSPAWQDLLKAAALEQLLGRRNTPSHVAQNVVRPLRLMATCAGDKEPWELLADDVFKAVAIGRQLQASGKLGDLVLGLVKSMLDPLHLFDAGPLYPALAPHRTTVNASERRAKFLKSDQELRQSLDDRKRAERLPERRAFWELIRIVMTEQPASFMDELRFAALRIMIATGFRIGEAVLLPLDWRREREYFTIDGRPAGTLGGYSKSLMIRHFAEKQQSENSDSRILVEAFQHIPDMFVGIVEESLARVAALTMPLRETLRQQTKSGRLLPWYEPHQLVPLVKLYTVITGNPIWLDIDEVQISTWVAKCKGSWSADNFNQLFELQCQKYLGGSNQLHGTIYVFLNRLRRATTKGKHSSLLRWANGHPINPNERIRWAEVHVCIDEFEHYIQSELPSKLSDLLPMSLGEGEIQTHELLFIHPKRSLAEERNGGVTDTTRYMAIGRPEPELVGLALGDHDLRETIFSRYGRTEEDKQLFLTSHMLRHLQNTELFRLGIADTIITKRFNRKSVTQSYEYDHRSLAEELDQLELPIEAEMALGEKATTVAKMIMGGRASGPIVEAFRQIQASNGDDTAFEFLKVEADGFHATPYGHCLNSFTVDPCPKHLECFAGCRHLSATNLPEQNAHLVRLERKLAAALDTAGARRGHGVGLANQIEHAKVRLDGVRRLLATKLGEKPFPDGPDLSITKAQGLLDD